MGQVEHVVANRGRVPELKILQQAILSLQSLVRLVELIFALDDTPLDVVHAVINSFRIGNDFDIEHEKQVPVVVQFFCHILNLGFKPKF